MHRWIVAGSVVLVLAAAAVGWAVWPDDPPYRPRTSGSPCAPARPATSRSTWTPASTCPTTPRPAEGAGGAAGARVRRHQGARRAPTPRTLAGRGYAVLTWTARGFGRSGGQIHLDSPDYEVRDAQRLLDWLAARPEVRTDAAGDPRVGVVGGSYGGALALLLAAPGPAGRRDRPDDHLERPGPRRSCRSRTGGSADRGRVQEGLGRPLLRRRRHVGSGGRALRRTGAQPRARRRRPAPSPAGRRPGHRPAAPAVPPTRLRPVRRRRLRRLPARSPPPAAPTRPPCDAAAPLQPGRRCSTGSRRRPC